MTQTKKTDDIRMNLASHDAVADRLEGLKFLFPEAFVEGKVDLERLRQQLGDFSHTGTERYGLTWAGKAEAIRALQIPSHGTLVPMRKESVNFDESENMIIEGDNLEVLKLLQKSYHGKIKMIYIDPPYNTGGDFIYPDNFKEGLETYLKYSGQATEEGFKATTNAESNGRYHSNWLNMMYPRLFMAKNLLEDEGVLLVSIDDHELANLIQILDEIFGEENRVAIVAWEKRFTRSNNARLFSSIKDSIVVYRRSITLERIREQRNEKSDSIYDNPDNDPRGSWTSVSYVNPATKAKRKNLVYKIKNPFTGAEIEHPTNAWKYEYEKYLQHQNENRLYWGKSGENQYPRLKKFLSEVSDGMVPVDLWRHEEVGTTDLGSKQLADVLGVSGVFDNPKPTKLIEKMISLVAAADDDAVILDFFAGSGSTAEAVLKYNSANGGNRKFILVQLPEKTAPDSVAYQAGFKSIAEVTRRRVRSYIEKNSKNDWLFADLSG